MVCGTTHWWRMVTSSRSGRCVVFSLFAVRTDDHGVKKQPNWIAAHSLSIHGSQMASVEINRVWQDNRGSSRTNTQVNLWTDCWGSTKVEFFNGIPESETSKYSLRSAVEDQWKNLRWHRVTPSSSLMAKAHRSTWHPWDQAATPNCTVKKIPKNYNNNH